MGDGAKNSSKCAKIKNVAEFKNTRHSYENLSARFEESRKTIREITEEEKNVPKSDLNRTKLKLT